MKDFLIKYNIVKCISVFILIITYEKTYYEYKNKNVQTNCVSYKCNSIRILICVTLEKVIIMFYFLLIFSLFSFRNSSKTNIIIIIIEKYIFEFSLKCILLRFSHLIHLFENFLNLFLKKLVPMYPKENDQRR